MADVQSNNILFGRGEYAITEQKVPKLIAQIKKFQETGVWIWSLVDHLGISKVGFKRRYYEVLNYKVEHDGFKQLQATMEGLVYPEVITHPTARTSNAAVQLMAQPPMTPKERETVINSLDGLTDAEKAILKEA